ncbi:ankyrin-2-like [Vespa velutina]|uniref:ankyrin-2-like n=1 Tax=Vespa velutina TaxID=202808 RepID=UPI001FB41B56|nr:ankyrin-2-like [Vespa velutina]
MTTEAEFLPIIRLQADDTTAFLRAARSGNLEKVIEYLDTDLDINTANSNGLNALHLASKDGHVEIVTELLKRGAKVDAATKKGNTALHIASLAGQAEIVSILIQYGSAVNIQSQNGFTPLYMAAQENHDQVVKLLLSNGANQSLATEDGFTPLAVAMQQGHDKVVSVLLENDSKGKVRLPALHIAAKKDDCKAADLLLQNDHKPDVTSKSGFTPLHIAAHYGNEEIARLLIKRGADVNYLAKHNISPLHVAAKWGKNNMVKILLENSAQIDAKTRDGLTPLHCAARSGHEEVVNTLLENSAPISARTKNGLAPLHMASQGDHVDAARALLYHRAPVDEVTIDYLTSLHVAAHCGHVRVAKLLLDRKADPNARALNGFTPLHIACKKNRIKVVELLLKHGASIESTTESGLTPLHVASFMGCMNIVIFLLQHEANPDVPTVRGETPLHLAARANQTDIIRILLRNGAKVDARAREQQTPLHIASRLGNIDIVMLLLQHGAAVDTTTKDMHTALHIAAKEGQEEVAAILVENNASVKATTKNGFTPLHIAAKYGNMNVAKILLQKDSKLDAQGKNDITPLHLACHYDHPNVANLLLEKGASPHLASQNGHTPLHIAARKNQMDIASTLLEGGANANAESKAGFTPLHLSSQKGHYDMTNLLIEHGADPNHKAKNGLTALHLCAQEDFVRVASILVKNDANVESQTETGYRPIHVAAHFGNLSMIRFLLKHNAEIDVRTAQNYTPLHQAAQQGHAHVVSALLEGNASHKARTNDGLTALNIAQKLGYISVMEVLKGMPYDNLAPDNKNWEEKYKVIAPESLQETSLMSDSDDEGASDALISEQPYKYLTADLMKSLRDDSLPIDVTKDDPIHRQVTKEEKQEFTQSNNYCLAENFDSNDTLNLGRLHFRSFLVSFLVDARGGAMKGCRHSGVRIIVPPRRATMPLRVTCRLVKPSKVANPPPLMEGEALATRIIEMGPVGATFLGPVLIDIPHFASIRGKEREIIILKSENGETWKEHDNSVDNDDTLLNTPHDPQMNAAHSGRITRIITTDFPQYFAIVTRIKQEVHVIGAEGGILMSSVANDVQAVFPPGALTKKIKVGLQAHVIPAELTAKLLGNCVAVSPVITIEPRRRKFHKPITLTIPVPQAANKGMINQYGGETPTLRLLCSIAGGTSEAQWEDVTGSTPLTFMNDRVSFTTTVSARFWLMDCRNISEVPKMATELYKESLFIPYITNFVIYSKRMDTLEATLRILCMTDGKEGMHTLERQEEFLEIVKSRDVEALHGKDLYIEFSGNLIPVTKSGVQLKFTFKAFRQNRLSFHVKVKDPLLDPVARMLFMREPKVAKGEPPQQPICVLNIVLPEVTSKIEIQKKLTATYEDSNIINQKMDFYKSKYGMEQKEKGDQPKDTSPSEEKFIADTLQKEQTDAATIHESFAQKAACPLESVDASYPNKIAGQQEHDLSPSVEKQTYSEKRKFWEDISKKRESYQRSESEVSRTSQLTVNESDSEYMQNVVSEEEITEVTSVGSDTMENVNIPDISECSVAEKAHYFEEQIQKELSKVPAKLQQQDIVKPEKDKSVKIQRVEKPIDVAQVETTRDVEHEGKELKSSHVEEKDKDESDKLRKEDFKDEEITYKERVDKFHRKEYRETSVVGMEKMIELDREVKDMMDKKEDEKKEFELKKKKEEKGIKKKASELKKKLEEEEVKRKEIELQKKQEAELKKKQEEEEAKRKEAELKKKQEEEEAKRKEAELKKKQEEEEEVKRKKEEEEAKRRKEEEEAKRKEAELKKEQEEEIAKRKETELKKKQEVEVKEEVRKSKRKEEMELEKEAYEELEKHIEKAALVQILPEQLERSIEEAREIHHKELPEHIDRIVEKHELELQKEYLIERGESPKHTMEVASKESEFIHSKQAEHKEDISMQEKGLGKDISTGRRVIKEETTIIWKVQEDGSLVQEKVTKTVQIEGDEDVPVTTEIINVPETSLEPKVLYEEHYTVGDLEEKLKEDTKIEISKKDQVTEFIPEVQKEKIEDLGKEKSEEDKISPQKSTIESDSKLMKKEFESRIPISMAKVEKDRNHKESSRSKISIESKRLLEKSEIDKSSIPQEEFSITSPVDKKKEFESRIPKRIIDTSATKSSEKDIKKGYHVKTETETCTVTEKKSSSQETTSKSETQTFSKTFTDPNKAFKLLEDMSEKDTIKLSKVDHKASSKLEKKEVVSSEISKGTDKYIVHEEKEQIESKKLSESKMKKESSTETVEKEESKSKKIDETAVQKMSINLQDGQETIDASASKSRVEAKKEQLSKKLEDKEGIMTEESGVNRLKESDIEIAIKISKEDEKKKVEDTGEPPITSKIFEDLGKVEMVTKGESHKETVESFDARHFIPTSKVDEKLASVKKDEKPEEKVLTHETLEERQRRAAKEIEARQIVECLIESIESEITKRSSITEDPRAEIIDSNYLQQLVKESVETDHEKLADDLTKKFESIMKKTMEKQLVESTKDTDSTAESVKRKSSIHEEEKRSTRDSMSISEDITKDEESSLHDRDESLLLSSSQARLPERDITMSPSSISDQIELEETMDVDTNELEDITKPTSSPQSEKLHSDRSSAQAESLQRESYEPQYDISLPKDRIIYDVSGARVLEIVEPGIDSQSRQDSVDVPSLEMDEYKISEDTGKTISSLHESAAVDSLERIAQERDMTFSPSTVSEDINVDYSLVHEQVPTTTTEKYEVSVKRADSFEIESPPLVSPRLKIRHDLEIKPVNWMIGDEKIEISETLQPSQVFNQELEEYETTIRKQRLSSQSESADLEQESATKSSEDPSVIESIKESVTTGDTTVTTVIKTKKFIVIPVSDQDIESELIENKLEVSCQELVDTLKREYEAKTPTEDLTTISIRRPLSLEEAKIKLSEMKLADSSKIETTTDQHEISIDKESIDIAKEITSISEEKLEAKEEVTSQIGKDEEIDGESLTEKHEEVIVKDITIEKIGLSLEEIAEPLKEDVKLLEDIETQDIAAGGALEDDPNKAVHVDDLAKEWMEPSLTKIKVSSDDYKRHVEKGFEKRDKAAKVSTVTSSDTCAFKIKKDDLPGVDLSARYAITVLDQVVKKEIAEVKESLEAARQDLIEELSENSETVIQIKDSPSEFQFKLQPESIPNDLPFLYRPPSLEQIAVDIEVTSKTESLIASEEKPDESKRDEKEIPATESGSEEIELEASGDEMDKEKVCMDIEMELDKSETETLSAVHEESKEDDDTRPSPVPASRSCSDVEYKDESSSSLHPPQPVPRRRHKPARASKKVTSESEVDPGSSSGESSNYQSCDYEIGSGSRPSSSDVEALQSATMPPSGTTSEYETAMMSVEHSATSRPTSQEYQTAVSTLSSRESMKSLSSFSSGHLGSIDSTSELSETLVASEPDADKGEEHEDLERAFDEEHAESDSSGSDIPMDDAMDKIDSNIPCRMKRSSEMIFQQIIDDNAALDTDLDEPILEQDTKGVDFATSAFVVTPGAVQSVDIMTARVTEDGVQSVSTQVISTQVTTSTTEIPIEETTLKTTMGIEIEDKPSDESLEMLSMEPDSLEPKSGISGTPDESAETVMQMSAHSMIQQASMSTSSTSGLSLDTVIEKAKSERSESPGSDSFELVDKPDIIDDFVVIEEVGREAEEFDSEGKSIRITAIPQVSSKQYDRDLENLITENKEDSQVSTSQTSRNNELFDFESEESPPQASNDDQYSQSYSDEEPYETGKKWIEMQFHTDARVYDIEYDRGPLEDIKEEEITDFEAGSSRFGSLGSHKESIGSVGSMRGSFGSTPDYDVLAGKKYFTKPSDHDTVSLSSLQEFEHLESAVAAENSKRLQCGSQDSINNGSLPRRYMTGRSGHGDDISLSSLKDFEGLERACREAHLIELRAREEEDLLEHESPENRYKMESLQRKSEISAAGSINPSTSGSDDYEKRIKEIDEIIRIAQSNVERLDRQDDTTEDISQIEITDIEKTGSEAIVPVVTEAEDIQRAKDTNIMETSTDSLELEDNADKKHPLCQSSDSLEMKTTLDFPSLSSDSLNNVRDARDVQLDVAEQFSNGRRMSSDSLDVPIIGQPDNDIQEESNNHSGRPAVDNSVGQSSSTETNIAKQDTTKLPSSSKT